MSSAPFYTHRLDARNGVSFRIISVLSISFSYEEKRQRTIRLVKAAVDRLLSEKQTVTIEAICRKSAELDSEGRGVKKSSILENPVAHAYYREHSTSYRIAQGRNRRTGRKEQRAGIPPSLKPLRIDPKRDVERVRYRYLQLTKYEIVERLLMVEQFYAESQEQLARLLFEMAEMQLFQREATRQPVRALNQNSNQAVEDEERKDIL